jgi:type IV secretory pathway VirB4 component
MKNTATQQFLPIGQIREGVIVMKDKSLRGVLLVSSLNFALKSEDEQSAIIYQFQDFLNSLDFSCQIIAQSRRLNITGYLEKLKEIESGQKNELLKVQTAEYRKFIEQIISGGSIMAKNFYVVVPYYPLIEIPGVAGSAEKNAKAGKKDLTEEKFQRGKYQLWQRMEYVVLGLRRCGLRASPLNTPELIEVLWAFHHPKEAESGYYPELPPEMLI